MGDTCTVATGKYIAMAAQGTLNQYLVDESMSPFGATYTKGGTYVSHVCNQSIANAALGSSTTIAVTRAADMVSGMFLKVNLPPLTARKIEGPRYGSSFPLTGIGGTVQEANALMSNGSKEMQMALKQGKPVTQEQIEDAKLKMMKSRYGQTFSAACSLESTDCAACGGDVTAVYTNAIGYMLLNNVELRVSGTKICAMSGVMMAVMDELMGYKEKTLNEMTGTCSNMSELACRSMKGFKSLYVPLPFFFTKNVASALPLVALQFSEIAVAFEFAKATDIITVTHPGYEAIDAITGQPITQKFEIEAFLTTQQFLLKHEDHSAMANMNYELPITYPVLHTVENVKETKISTPLPFNLILTQLCVFLQTDGAREHNQKLNFATILGTDPVLNAKLNINNVEYVDASGNELRVLHNYLYYKEMFKFFMYPITFALAPTEAHQMYTGSLNFSKCDSVTLSLAVDPIMCSNGEEYTVNVMGMMHNIFVVKDGVGGLRYAS